MAVKINNMSSVNQAPELVVPWEASKNPKSPVSVHNLSQKRDLEPAKFGPSGHKLTQLGSSGPGLGEWLEVDWFYPAGFSLLKVEEHSGYFEAIGEQYTARFLKPLLRFEQVSRQSFLTRLAIFQKYISLNNYLAGETFSGLSVIAWMEGEPYWRENFSIDELEPIFSLDGEKLEPVLLIKNTRALNKSFSDGDQFSKSLALNTWKFHCSGKPAANRLRQEDTNLVIQRLYNKLETEIKPFSIFCGPYLESAARCMFDEARVWLNRRVYDLETSVIDRGCEGHYSLIHSDLRLENIRQLASASELAKPLVVGREREEISDVLEDLVSLENSLRANGFSKQADDFLQQYFKLCPSAVDLELLSFYRVFNSLLRVSRIVRFENDLESLESCLSLLKLAWEETVQLEHPFLLFLVGDSEGNLKNQLLKLLSVNSASASSLEIVEGFDKFLGAFSASVPKQNSMLVSAPHSSKHAQQQISAFAEERKLVSLTVILEQGRGRQLLDLHSMPENFEQDCFFKKKNRKDFSEEVGGGSAGKLFEGFTQPYVFVAGSVSLEEQLRAVLSGLNKFKSNCSRA